MVEFWGRRSCGRIYGEARIAFSTAWNSSNGCAAGRAFVGTRAGDLGGLVLDDLDTPVPSDRSTVLVVAAFWIAVAVSVVCVPCRICIAVANSVALVWNGETVSVGSAEGEDVP